MVWGKAFMLPPWSNSFDTLRQHPPGSQKFKGKAQQKTSKKKAQKEALKPYEVFICSVCVCLCVFYQSVFSKSPACYDHTPCAVSVFSRLPVRVVGCEIGSLCSPAPSLASTDSSLLLHIHHLSLRCTLHLSVSLRDSDLE